MNKDKFIKDFISFFGVVELYLLCFAFYFSYGCMDHAEHLHASMLIWQGKVPYLDFFEHHNPLLWYILSPIVGLSYPSPNILYISRLISALAYFGIFGVLYKIFHRFMGGSFQTVFLGVLIYFTLPESYFLLYELHPDSFMLLSYFIGLYYFFLHLEDLKPLHLNISFIFFTISFLFLQKILITLFYTGICIAYLTYKKQLSLKSVIKASLLPLFIIILFISYLYHHNILSIYLKFNYELNFYMQLFMGKAKYLNNFVFTTYLPLIALFTLKYFLKENNRYKNILIFIVVAECISKYLTGAPYVQYFIFTNIISVIIVAYYIINNINHKYTKIFLYTIFGVGIFFFIKKPFNIKYPKYIETNQYIYQTITKDDYLISSVNYLNIYAKDTSYYWFGGGNIAPIAYYLYQYKDPFLINNDIISYQPKIIFNNLYVNQLLINNIENNTSLKDFTQNLKNIYHKMPIKHEDEISFIKRWSRADFSVYNEDLLKLNYTIHETLPLLIRKDIANTK